ncbi:COP23 domain-containing protein [Roseofilum sp. BLCC_M91]|uniref:COP23 domain-containing protein n=1 Tax=Roseofilum halophilum BLCC-M91 TaxID=3022259 RepID=A0ABT7BKG5_9CYAN|nr:COP23 domain-containing protein [Roseofilum halophilum]MDJ1179682.1 COP23 domain-containing protein [Roseofilum halophilum BLCC-M91]
MKLKSTVTALMLSLLAVGATAQIKTNKTQTFACGASRNGIPTTLALVPRGNIPIIRWVSEYFTPFGYDPQTRCEQVSNRLQTYQEQGIANFITTGIQDGLDVICVSSVLGGPCTGLLFTLQPGESASRVIQDLFDVGQYGLNPLLQGSNTDQVYIDLNQLLQEAPTDLDSVESL